MDKDFVLKAENPVNFAAFCLNMKKLRDENKNYIHYTPIFFDATCSGIQHFAGMLGDVTLANEVNLIKSNKVNDIYQSLVKPINDSIKEGCRNTEIFKNHDIENIDLGRKELKRIIMTKAYNVTTYGIIEQLKASLEKIEEVVTNSNNSKKTYKKILYKVPANNETGYIMLNSFEIGAIGSIISDNIFKKYPELEKIYKYLTSVAHLMLKLNIPIT